MSMQSDLTVASDDEPGLEETIVDLMKGTGLYATIKAQVAKFIENTGKLDPSKFICPDRADENILISIYEYLQWVGMKQTCSMLLFESPVKIDASSVSLSTINEPEFCPKLQKLIARKEDSSAEEDDESQNIVQPSGDVPVLQLFSASKKSRTEEKTKNKEKEVNGNIPQAEETPKIPKTSSGVPKVLMKKSLSEERLINFSFEESSGLPNEKNGTSLQTLQQSIAEPTAVNEAKTPHILDLTFTPEHPVFVRNKGVGEQTNANVWGSSPTGQEADALISDNKENTFESSRANNEKGDDDESRNSSFEEGNKSSKEKHQNHMNVDKNLNSVGKKSSGGKDSYANDDFDDISTSDMLSLEIEEDDTQDISVATDTFGMSACDHVVSLK